MWWNVSCYTLYSEISPSHFQMEDACPFFESLNCLWFWQYFSGLYLYIILLLYWRTEVGEGRRISQTEGNYGKVNDHNNFLKPYIRNLFQKVALRPNCIYCTEYNVWYSYEASEAVWAPFPPLHSSWHTVRQKRELNIAGGKIFNSCGASI